MIARNTNPLLLCHIWQDAILLQAFCQDNIIHVLGDANRICVPRLEFYLLVIIFSKFRGIITNRYHFNG